MRAFPTALAAILGAGCILLAGSASSLPPELSDVASARSWLLPADECPADVLASKGRKARYLAEGCRDRVAACLESCHRGDAPDCYALALLVQESEEAPPLYTEALFLRACKLGIDSGCTNRAAGMTNAEDASPEVARCAVATFRKVCERGDPWACTMFGFHLAYGDGVEQDLERALRILPGACKLSESDAACVAARDLIERIGKARTGSREQP